MYIVVVHTVHMYVPTRRLGTYFYNFKGKNPILIYCFLNLVLTIVKRMV